MKISAPKINKNIIIGISAVALVLLGIIVWVLFQKGRIPEKKEIISPPQKEETTKEVLERLTPKEPKSQTEKEKKELEKLLKQLTPEKPKPMTGKEQKELEELLKKLTPQ